MINYILSYDVAALSVLVIFIIYYYMKKRFKSTLSSLFNQLVIVVTAIVVFDLIGVYFLQRRDSIPIAFNYVVQCCYQLSQHMATYLFTYYVIQLTKMEGKPKPSFLVMLISFGPALFVTLAILTTPFTKWFLYFDENKDYCHGPLLTVGMIVAMGYMSFCVIRVLTARKKLTLKKRITMIIFVVLAASGVVIQWFYPEYLLTGFGATLGVICVYLAQQNPNDLIDTRTDIFNRRALGFESDKLISTDTPFKVMGLSFKNFESLCEQYGYMSIDELFTSIANYLCTDYGTHNAYAISNTSFAVIVRDVSTDDLQMKNAIKRKMETGFFVKGKKVRLIPAYCVVGVPDDVHKTRQLLDNIDLGIEYAMDKTTDEIVYAKDFVDIRERKIMQLEALSERAQKEKEAALRAEQSKSMFLAQMSHEIRTPMTAILGITEIIERDTRENTTKEHALALRNSGKALLTIINDILDYSKIEAGKFDILDEEYYFASSMYNTISMIQVKASDKNLNIYADVDPTIPSVLKGDEVRARQVFMNLLSNAVKYTNKGYVSIKVGWEKKGDTANIIFSVKDTGIGIKPESMEKLFNEFARFDVSKNKEIEGTGLGLAIVKQLLNLMNGDIKVESEYGKGSKFTVTLPQKIIDETPAVQISNPKSYIFLILDAKNKESEKMISATKKLGIPFDVAHGREELEELMKNPEYTHIIISSEEYSFITKEHKDSRIVTLANEKYYSSDGGATKYITRPVCSLNIASMLENQGSVSFDKKASYRPFTAENARILIVDDNGVNLEICAGLLKNHKMKIDYAGSGDKCLMLTKQNVYNLIFLDHMMPGKDGIETLHLMRAEKDNLNRETPVIAFTANAVSGMKELFKENGFNGFLSKPIDIVKMDDIIVDNLGEDLVKYVDRYEDDAPSYQLDSNEPILPHMDMEKAMNNCGGNLEILINLLKVIKADSKKKLPLIRQYEADGDIVNYTIELHALKTTAANIGYIGMSEKAKALEMAGRRSDIETIQQGTAEVLEEYEELVADIEAYFAKQNEEANENSEKSSMSLHDRMVILLLLIREFETDVAERIVATLSPEEGEGEVKELIEEVKSKFELFDYDGAAEIIEKLADMTE